MKADTKVLAATLFFAVLATSSVLGTPQSTVERRLVSGTLFGPTSDPVRVEGGLVSGTPAWGYGVWLYRGIPFAAPPVGNLRWRPPQPVMPWEGVRKADHFSAACMQPPNPYTEVSWQDGLVPISEDCLYLNVWTPAKSATDRLPVMVYLYAGAFRMGAASQALYDGSNLAKKGVVVVTLNYRVNIFGFFAHPELTKESENHASGNQGLLDQLAAFKWVQKNIAQFGGDPNRVTVFGHSAGSNSVNAHMASPLARGLFQGAIAQSHTNFGRMQTLADAEAAGEKLARSAGASSLAALRAMSAQDVLGLVTAAATYSAIVDGWYLPQDIYTIYATGKQMDVPLLTGSVARELESGGPSNSGYVSRPPESASQFIEHVRQTYGSDADAFLKVYPAGSTAEAVKSHYDAGRDAIEAQHRLWVRLQSKTAKSKIFFYLFTRAPSFPEGAAFSGVGSELGAYHGSENNYIFNALRTRDWAWTDSDRKFADVMSSYWTNFAKTGDPNGEGLPKWPVYDPRNELLMNLTDKPQAEAPPYKAGLDFFEARQARQRSR